MTLGEKIIKLRTSQNMDQALPQIDKVLKICELFSVSADELLRDNVELKLCGLNVKNKYFGTDGFRGEANIGLNSLQAYKVGRFLGWYYSKLLNEKGKIGVRPRVIIGKDTRRSSYMLEYSIAAGLSASGADVYMLHVTTTPSISYITHLEEFDCGIMITASHNPY